MKIQSRLLIQLVAEGVSHIIKSIWAGIWRRGFYPERVNNKLCDSRPVVQAHFSHLPSSFKIIGLNILS